MKPHARLACAALVLVASAPSATGQGRFSRAQRVIAGVSQEIRAHGDVDGDGDVDLLVFTGASTSGTWLDFRVWFNDGGGEFAAGAVTALPAGAAVRTPLLADVTGDGLPDLVVTIFGSAPAPSLLRLYRNLGAGIFAAAGADVVLAGTPQALAAGDQTGNGTADVVVAAGVPAQVSWSAWNGTSLAEGPRLTVPSFSASSIAVDDWDGNGLQDAVLGSWFTESVAVVRTLPGHLVLGPVLSVPGPVGGGHVLATGDLEGDGDADLLVASYDLAAETTLWVIESLGGGLHQVLPATSYESAVAPISWIAPHLGDWDADGDLDAFVHGAALHCFENDGANGFAHRSSIATQFSAPGSGTADLDADGRLDYVAPRALAWGNGTFHDSFGAIGDYPYVLRDWEGDGDLDALDAIGRVAVNDGTGTFSAPAALRPVPPSGFTYQGTAAIDDFTGDGLSDQLVEFFELVPFGPFTTPVFHSMRLLVDAGTGTLADLGAAAPAGVAIDGGAELRTPTADVDGDGDVDVLAVGTAWQNDGTGFFTSGAALPAGRPTDVGDVDLDGDLDVLCAGIAVTLARNQGAAGSLVFNAEVLPLALAFEPRFLDLDEDGDVDVASGAGGSGVNIEVLENAAGTWSGPLTLVAGPFDSAILASEDVDGDGLRDLIAGPYSLDFNGDDVLWFRRTGGLSFEAKRSYVADPIRCFADLDADGDLDPAGRYVADTWRFDGAGAGTIRQYGAGKPGTGGVVPLIGASGPLHAGVTAALHVRRARGGALAFLCVGLAETALAGTPNPALTLYTFPWIQIVPLSLGGAAGVAGAGALDLPFPVAPTFAGVKVFDQLLVVDPAATGGITFTNGLELHFGT